MKIGRLQPLQLLFICAKIHFGIRRICEDVWRCNDTCNDIFWSPHVCEWGSVNCDTRPTAVTLRFLFHLSWIIWENPYITFGSSSKERILYSLQGERHRHRQTALKDTQLKEFQLSDNPAVASLSDSVDLHCCSWPHRMPCAWRVLTGSLWER